MKRLGSWLVYLLFLTFFLPMLPPSCVDMSHDGKKVPESTQDTIGVDSVGIDTISTDTLYDQDSLTLTTETRQEESSKEVDHTSTADKDMSAMTYLFAFFVVEYFLTFFSVAIILIIVLQRLFNRRWINVKDRYLLMFGLVLFSSIGTLHYKDLLWGYWVMLLVYFITAMESMFLNKTKGESKGTDENI